MKFKMICLAESSDGGGYDLFIDGMIGVGLGKDEALGAIASALFNASDFTQPIFVKTLKAERQWRDRILDRIAERELKKENSGCQKCGETKSDEIDKCGVVGCPEKQ